MHGCVCESAAPLKSHLQLAILLLLRALLLLLWVAAQLLWESPEAVAWHHLQVPLSRW
jgi:hypothetical protein